MKIGREEVELIYNRLGKKEKNEVVQLDDITTNWKLMGSRSSRIMNGFIYKLSEFVQLPAPLKIWGLLRNKC